MLKLQTRIFADHYQFYIHDAEYRHYEDKRLDWNAGKKLAHGYMATEHAIYVSTKADLNDHCVKVYLLESPNKSRYETIFEGNIEIPSGKLLLSSPCGEDDEDLIQLDKGKYRITVCGENIGKDMFSYSEDFEEDMSDEEYCRLNKFESYDIFLEYA